MNEQTSVVDLNNEGVFLLMADEDRKAICRLRESLAILKSTVNQSTSPMDERNDEAATSTSVVMNVVDERCGVACALFDNQDVSVSHRSRLDTNMVPCERPRPCLHLPLSIGLRGLQQESQAFIYSRPFTFNGIPSLKDLDSFLHVHSAVIIFNMALAHHRLGKSSGRRSFLEKAVQFYDMCLELLEDCDPHMGDAKLIEIASLNNASLLRYELGDDLVARKGLNSLSVALVSANNDVLVHLLNEEDARGFLLNVMLLQHAIAAAAA